MTPVAIVVLSIKMVVFVWINDEGNLTRAARAPSAKRRSPQIRHILANKIGHVLTGASAAPIQICR